MPETTDGPCTYQIEIRGRAAVEGLSAASPLQVTVLRAEANSTLLAVCTDQSGLVGLLRYLHGRGRVLLSVQCQESNQEPDHEGV